MTIQPTLRLAIPAVLFVVLAVAPRQPAAAGDEAPRPILGGEAGSAPDVPLDELFHEIGAPDAPVTVVEFSDFGCPYCGRFAVSTFPTLRKEYVEAGKVRWRFVPFVLGMFPNGSEAMRASACVAEQGDDAFWAMHDTLFAAQEAWKGARDADPLFRRYAEAAGADGEAYMACYRHPRSADRVAAARALATDVGVRSTPTFFVNGRMIQGALPLEEFRTVLDGLVR